MTDAQRAAFLASRAVAIDHLTSLPPSVEHAFLVDELLAETKPFRPDAGWTPPPVSPAAVTQRRRMGGQ